MSLEIQSLSFSYDGRKNILDQLSLSLKDPSILLINGKSGSGKSTLLNIICKKIAGNEEFSKIYLNQKNLGNFKENEVFSKLAYLSQNPDWQLCASTPYEEIRFGLEYLKLDEKEIEKRCDEALELAELGDKRDLSVHALSGGQKQKLICSAILALDKELILLDEPFAQLDLPSIYEFINFLQKLKAKQQAHIIICEHKSQYLETLADQRFTLSEGKLQSYQAYPEAYRSVPKTNTFGNACISIHDFSVQVDSFDIIKKTSNCFYEGERIAIMGKNGSGKSSFVQALSSLIRFKGELNVQGKIGHVFQNPDLMLIQSSVEREIQNEEVLRLLDLEAERKQYPQSLSKGQRFRCAVGSVLQNSPDILILDEASSGQDTSHINAIFNAIYARTIKTIFFCSHDIELVLAHASRLILFENGILYKDIKQADLSREKILSFFDLKGKT